MGDIVNAQSNFVRVGAGSLTGPPADVRFAVAYVCSRPLRQETYDPRPAKERVGYEPRDVWPYGVEDLLGSE